MSDPIIPSNRLRYAVFGTVVVLALVFGPTKIRLVNEYDGFQSRSDFTVYYEASKAFFDGREPYTDVRVNGIDHYIYPPLFAIVLHPLTALSAETAGVIWFFICVGLLFASYRETRLLLQHVLPPGIAALPWWLALAPSLAVFRPVVACLERGQTAVVILYLLLLGARLAIVVPTASGKFGGGLAFAAATAIKLTPGLPAIAIAVMLLSAPRARSGYLRHAFSYIAGFLLGIVVFVYFVPFASLGPERTNSALTSFVDKVIVQQSAIHLDSRSNQGIVKAVERVSFMLTDGPDTLPWQHGRIDVPAGGIVAARCALALIAVSVIGVTIAAGRAAEALNITAAFSLAVLASILASPISWMHHHSADVVAVLFVPLLALARGRGREARLLAGLAVVIVNGYFLVEDYVRDSALLGVGMAAWFIVAAIAVISWSLASDRTSVLACQRRKMQNEPAVSTKLSRPETS